MLASPRFEGVFNWFDVRLVYMLLKFKDRLFVALKRAVGLGFFGFASTARSLFLVSGGLLGQKDGLDVGKDSSLGDGDSREQLVQLLVVADGQLEMAGVDSGLLVVPSSIAGQFKHLSSQIFEDGGQVDRGSGSDALSVVSLAEKTVETSHGELESGSNGSRLLLASGLGFASLATSRHC